MMTSITSVLLMAGQPGAGSGGGLLSLLPLLLIIVVFYFFMIRPQVKRQKELANYRSSLKKGDKVVTTGGIYGRIHEVSEQTVLLEIDNNVHIKVDKGAIIKDSTDLAAQQK